MTHTHDIYIPLPCHYHIYDIYVPLPCHIYGIYDIQHIWDTYMTYEGCVCVCVYSPTLSPK